MNYYNDNKITFQQLVMEQIKIIQKICSKELKNGDKILKNALGEQLIEGEDTRHSFLQSIEVLGSLLTPYFGTMMDKEGSKGNLFDLFCEYSHLELKEVIENDEFKKKIQEMFNIDNIEEIKSNEGLQRKVNVFFLNDKIKEGFIIFRLLVKVFKANEFLSSQSYGEGSGDIDSGNDAFVEDDEEDLS